MKIDSAAAAAAANGEIGEKLSIRFRRFCRPSPQIWAKIAKRAFAVAAFAEFAAYCAASKPTAANL